LAAVDNRSQCTPHDVLDKAALKKWDEEVDKYQNCPKDCLIDEYSTTITVGTFDYLALDRLFKSGIYVSDRKAE